MIKIVTDTKKLREKCSKVEPAEGRFIASKIIKFYDKYLRGKALGLAAPQLGFQKQVCVLFARPYPLVLMNPTIIDKSPTLIETTESCLSLPNIEVLTLRPRWVVVQSDNLADQRFESLESIVVQHEIHHLQGILITDIGERLIKDEKRRSHPATTDTSCFSSNPRRLGTDVGGQV